MTSRYSITFHDRPGGKNRYRHALKLLGAEQVRIVEAEAAAGTPAPKPDNLPSSAEAKAVCDLFGRRHDTPWPEEEIDAFRKLVKRGVATLVNLAIIAGYYRTERKKEGNFCRTSVLTFLRHFDGELDKARAHKPSSRAGEWADSAKAGKIVPMPAPTEAERAAGLEKLRAIREARG